MAVMDASYLGAAGLESAPWLAPPFSPLWPSSPAPEHQTRRKRAHPRRGASARSGSALRGGLDEASKELVFLSDGDGQYDPEELEKVLLLLESYDVISGYRIERRESWVRSFNAWAWSKLVGAVFGLRIRDVDCAYKLYPRRFLDMVDLRSTGALIDVEMLARARRLGFTIGQIGVRHLPRLSGDSSGANLSVIARAFRELFALRTEILRTKKLAPTSIVPAARPSPADSQGREGDDRPQAGARRAMVTTKEKRATRPSESH